MLCHAWAKAHVHNDDLFALLAIPLAQRADQLTAHEIALSIYGYAHFRKRPPELFEPFLRQFSCLLESGGVSDGDLLMLGNALGRVGCNDAAVANALKSYVRRQKALVNLSHQTI